MTYPLDERLCAIAALVREQAVLADVGSDHAYLPIALIQAGKISRAVATDIHAGPVERAKAHLCASGIGDAVTVLCTDGLDGVEPYAPTDIVIAGMGGELMVRILTRAPWIRTPDIRLILQPMTHAGDLRRYLWDAGYSISAEQRVKDGEHIYQILCAQWTGKAQSYTEADLLVGRSGDPSQLQGALIKKELAHLRIRTDGCLRAAPTEKRTRQLAYLRQLSEELKKRWNHDDGNTAL